MKKGEFHFDELGKLIVALVVLVILVAFAYAARDKMIAAIKNIFSGGFL